MTATLTCEQTLDMVAERRVASRDDALAVTAHLAGCDECRVAVLSCGAARDLMDEAVARRLAPRAAVTLAAHLTDCDRCRRQAEEMLRSQSLFDRVEPPAGLAERLAAAAREQLARQLRARAFRTPLGWASLAYTDSGILLVERAADEAAAYEHVHARLGDFVTQARPRDDVGGSAVDKLIAYHEGERVVFDEPLDLSLVPAFTQRVLRATSRIPYGEVRPYAWVAREVGKPRAARAVGQSLHINPVAPIIPCHRVVASDNTLGGYGGGPEMKRWLLRLEGYLKN
jgi:methylated-DNA-[protein]-cysteine S-methyltransferase